MRGAEPALDLGCVTPACYRDRPAKPAAGRAQAGAPADRRHMPMGELDGKAVLVTGGASGIGLASARRFHAGGAQVVLVDRDAKGVARAAAELAGTAVVADVSQADQWQAILHGVEAAGGVDIVHLNAGMTSGQDHLPGLSDDLYRRIMGVNVDHVVFGIRALLPGLVDRGGGAVVVTASLAGLVALPGDPIYTLTKHAVVGLVRALAPRLREQRVTVNAICPGMVDTPLLDGPVKDMLVESGFPLIEADAVADAVYRYAVGEETGKAVVVQAGREPIEYRFSRPPGPRVPGAEGAVPPGWLGDPGEPSARPS